MFTNFMDRAAAIALVLTAGLALSRNAYAAAEYTLAPVQYGMQLKAPDGQVVFEYITKKPEGMGITSPSVACFHPVNTPSGERITNIAPNDHPHHRGIWFGFMDSEFHVPNDYSKAAPTHPVHGFTVERGDFWAWGVYAPREGRLIQTRDIKLLSADANHAQLEIHNDWLIDNRKMMDETDEVSVSKQEGVYVIDLYYRFAPLYDYILRQTAFGGFAVQARKDGESYYATAAGKTYLPDPHYSYPESDLPSEPWYDYTIQLKDSGKVLGVAVIDHPLNPPTLWHNARYLWMLNPCITALGPMTIHPNTPLDLRYRVVVHDGATPTEVLNKLSAEWRAMHQDAFAHE
jgi:hypothetical protein